MSSAFYLGAYIAFGTWLEGDAPKGYDDQEWYNLFSADGYGDVDQLYIDAETMGG